MVIVGSLALLLALAMVGPVAVNLPDSWFGGLLAAGIAAGGFTLMYRGARRLWST